MVEDGAEGVGAVAAVGAHPEGGQQPDGDEGEKDDEESHGTDCPLVEILPRLTYCRCPLI
jgi:hypothetical protein